MDAELTRQPPPTVLPCMHFCDGVILEQGTGKVTLVGTFSGIAAPVFPSPPRDLRVFAELTSFVGEAEVRLACIRLDLPEPEEIYSTAQVFRFPGKLLVQQIYYTWRQFQFPNPGVYAFQLWSQGECLAERRLTARLIGD